MPARPVPATKPPVRREQATLGVRAGINRKPAAVHCGRSRGIGRGSCRGGFISLSSFWQNGSRTIAADIGSRLVATGYVVVFYVGMADNFGITQTYAKTRFFGPWQAVGFQVGEIVIALGFLLLIPFHRLIDKQSKMT